MNAKDINIEDKLQWFGSNILGWDLVRSKYIFRNKSYKGNIDQPLLSVTQRDGVIKRSDLVNKVWNPSDDVSGYKLVEPNDFVISLRSFEGGIELSNIKGLVSPAYTVLETIEDIDSNYFRWMMKSYSFIIELNKHVTGIRQGKNIGWDDFADIYLLKPSLKEQKIISKYLDLKTKKIDLLIKKIKTRIELLNEQKTALINKFITKGINPNVEMKDSRIEWVGKIPHDFELSKLKYCCSYNDDSLKEDTDPNYEFNYIEVSDVSYDNGITIKEKIKFGNSPSRARRIVKKNDVIISTVRTYLRAISIIPDYVDTICSTGFCVLRSKCEKINPEFLSYLVKSEWFIAKVVSNSCGVSYPAINSLELIQIPVIIPPKIIQNEICECLKKENSCINQLIEKELSRINLLKEYRQSLISSVVTGKIRITEDMI